MDKVLSCAYNGAHFTDMRLLLSSRYTNMERIESIEAAETALVGKANKLLEAARAIVSGNASSAKNAVNLLSRLREAVYEDLNQIQHEGLILEAAQWLRENALAGREAEWWWNPRQTGGHDEPDLRCISGSDVVVAEVTASNAPVGVIDSRMMSTLEKLAATEGKRYYFVRTESMRKRAKTKVDKGKWDIRVVQLP